ncbi:MFS transporter [Streptomyces chattanoogensis]|nr:MFS transporter [Streptomyces chattanoogensis]
MTITATPGAPPATGRHPHRPRHWLRAGWLMTASGWSANQFSALLGAYRADLGLTTATTTGLFAVYVLGLVPALLLAGPAADRHGRRPLVYTALAVSFVSTCLLMAGPAAGWLLWPGRFLTGLGAGALLTAGSAWVKELSCPPHGTAATPGAAARRSGLFLSAGFASGGLAAALIAQWSPCPMVMAYVPHLLLATAAAVSAARVPETSPSLTSPSPASPSLTRTLRLHNVNTDGLRRVASASTNAAEAAKAQAAKAPAEGAGEAGHRTRTRSFRRLVLPVAPWVFAAPAIAFAVVPGLVDARLDGWGTVYAGIVTAVTPGAGILVAPLARRLAARHRIANAVAGLAAIVLGFAVDALAVAHTQPAVALFAAALLGAGYGLCVAHGLTEVAALAPPHRLARLTARFWSVCYLGFCAPYAFTLLTGAFSPPAILVAAAVLAALTLAAVALRGVRTAS